MRRPGDIGLTRRDALAGGALAVAGTPLAATAVSKNSLRARADRKGLLVGSCLDVLQVDDNALVDSLARDCNILIPENAFAWSRIQRSAEAPLDFREAEAVAAVARRIGASLRGHNLVWYRTMPNWVTALVPTLTASQAADLMTGYVSAVASRWRGQLVHQEPVNEPTESPGRLRDAVFGAKLGERYIDLAFETARHADPDAVLFINESGIEQETDWQIGCRATFLKLLERLKARGIPVDAVGVQGHLALNDPFSQTAYARLLRDISDMGYKILITEFDILDRGFPGTIAQRDAAVAALGKAFLDVSFDHPACGGVLDWSHSDKYSWLRKTPKVQRADGQPLRPAPLDDAYQPKPLWKAMAAAIDGAANRKA